MLEKFPMLDNFLEHRGGHVFAISWHGVAWIDKQGCLTTNPERLQRFTRKKAVKWLQENLAHSGLTS